MTDALPDLIAQTGQYQLTRGWFGLMGLIFGAIILIVTLAILTSLRRTRRQRTPQKTPHVDAWAEAGRRALPEPSARDILGDDGNNNWNENGDENER